MANQEQDPNDADIPEERAIEQQIIPFMGDDLAAALAAGGSIYISLPGMCTAMELNTRGQLQRVQRTRTLAKGLRRIPIQTKGGFQRINCLRVDLIALWLAGVQTGSVKEEFRAKIEAYQEELAPIATEVFLRMAGISTSQLVPTADPQLREITEQIDILSNVTMLLREYLQTMLADTGQISGMSLKLDQAVHLLESLVDRQDDAEKKIAKIDERTQRLTSTHAGQVKDLVDRIASAIVRHSPVINTKTAHSMLWTRLKNHFRVAKYEEIPDERFADAMKFLYEEQRKFTKVSQESLLDEPGKTEDEQ